MFSKIDYVFFKRAEHQVFCFYSQKKQQLTVQVSCNSQEKKNLYKLKLSNEQISYQIRTIFKNAKQLFKYIQDNAFNEDIFMIQPNQFDPKTVLTLMIRKPFHLMQKHPYILIEVKLQQTFKFKNEVFVVKKGQSYESNQKQLLELRSMKKDILILKAEIELKNEEMQESKRVFDAVKLDQQQKVIQNHRNMIKCQANQIKKLEKALQKEKQSNIILQMDCRRIRATAQHGIQKVNNHIKKAFQKMQKYQQLIRSIASQSKFRYNNEVSVRQDLQKIEEKLDLLVATSPFSAFQQGRWVIGKNNVSKDTIVSQNKEDQTIQLSRSVKNKNVQNGFTWVISSQKIPSKGNVAYNLRVINIGVESVGILFGVVTKNSHNCDKVFNKETAVYNTNGSIWQGSNFGSKFHQLNSQQGQWNEGQSCTENGSLITLFIEKEIKKNEENTEQTNGSDYHQKEGRISWYLGNRLLAKIQLETDILKEQILPIVYLQGKKDIVQLINCKYMK